MSPRASAEACEPWQEPLSVNTFRTVIPQSANHALARTQKQLAVDQQLVAIDRGMQIVATTQRIAIVSLRAAALVGPGVQADRHQPSMRPPPPAGILPSFLTSRWTRSQHRADWKQKGRCET
jgi:hypothetical protein